MNEIILILAFLLSFFLTLYGTPITLKVAERYHFYDCPDGALKNQRQPVPYMGGVIIYFAFISPVGLMFPFSQELLGILFAGSIMLVVGLFDDLKAMTPFIKFLFQIVAIYMLMKSGIRINLVFLPNWVNVTFSFIWILAVINSFNIIDIMDGFAPSIGMLAAASIFVISLYTDKHLISILSISLTASLAAFLKYNWEPARIYLGDAGSMFIGLVLGALSIMVDYTIYNDLAFISGLIIFSIPLFDTLYVIILRLLQGRSPFFGSPDHFILRLRKRFQWSSAKTVSVVFAVQIMISGIVILNFYSTYPVTIFTTIGLGLLFLFIGILLSKVKMTP